MLEFLEKYLKLQYDSETEILDVTADEQFYISSEEHSNHFSTYLVQKIKEYSESGRVYLMVDFGKIILEPAIIGLLTKQIVDYIENHLYPNGGCAYGISISRVTIKVSYKHLEGKMEKLFKTKDEALTYLLEQREINSTVYHQ